MHDSCVDIPCGVPFLPVAALETNLWHQSDTYFNRDLQEGEQERNWLFYGPTVSSPAFRSVWNSCETRVVRGFGMSNIVYYLNGRRDQRSGEGMFKLFSHPVTGIQAESFYVLFFKPTVPGKKGNFRTVQVGEKDGLVSPAKQKECAKPLQGTAKGMVSKEDMSLDNISSSSRPRLVSMTSLIWCLTKELIFSTFKVEADAVSEQVLGNLEYLEIKDELIKVDGMLQNLEKEIDDDAKIGRGWLLLDRDRDGKVTPDEVAADAMYLKDRLALQQLISSLSKDKGMVKVNDWEDESRNEFLRLVKKEVEGKDVDGEKAAMKAYKAASDQSDEVSEADKVSSALMEKVDGMIQNMEKEIDDVKIGKGFLDRDRVGKVTPAALCT
ncbi:hypothetical protein HID58_060629 [Brassica napus]|uniref:BnaC04g22640D protein n=3 Tax=Brassica napus TaxID=3708 RepID=A0A078I9G4_BRANA|nr:hypothetical protein HID58_060629 [Brassica napus]CAF1846350.1 unnamed protein product [Brassica napus]CDY45778.1 BnaC04g22640D [Brassica napus]